MTSPLLFPKLLYETIEWEKRTFFAYIAASAHHFILKEVENQIFRHKWNFKHTCVLNNPHWQSTGIVIFFCKYYIVISDTLVGCFLDVLFLLLTVILLELYEKPGRNKDWVKEKSIKKNLCEGHHFFDCTSYFLYHFLLLSSSTPLPKWHTC